MQETEHQKVRHLLEERIADADLLKPYRPTCHDEGDLVRVSATGVFPAVDAELAFRIEKQIGGGFAGQVYRVVLEEIEGEPIEGLEVGKTYAVKILVPPSRFSLMFRNLLYAMAFQGSFSAQVNPDAVRAGALWQKLIRRGAALSLGSERAVVDVHATFHDEALLSYGEISEWVAGRVWRFEINDRVFRRLRTKLGDGEPPEDVGSHEYLRKKAFMRDLVRHFHTMGAPELARQYEWWTLKSQPNALKRMDGVSAGLDDLCAIDFRAGLALLPFLPMAPGDFVLILRGLFRGRLVQFDRGDMAVLDAYLMEHAEHFAGYEPAVAELVEREAAYRASLPDVTHHHVRLFRGDLRASIRNGFITAWRTLALVDEQGEERLRSSTPFYLLFLVLGLFPLVGRPLRRIIGDRGGYAQHVHRTLTSWSYFVRRFRVSQQAKLIDWHRDEAVSSERATALADRPVRTFLRGMLVGWMPAKLHRYLTDWAYFKERTWDAVSYPVKLYMIPAEREQWLRDQVEEGREEGMLSDAEADDILAKLKEPFIQKYLKSVAVHACTLPVTQIVTAVAAPLAIKFTLARGGSPAEATAAAVAVAVFLQTTPISPGSLTRGAYVFFMMIKDRDIKNYWIAAFVSFWHYIGYLAFPIQMVVKYPDLARFMAGRWAAKLVNIIPVFGERGALLEHWMFDGFFNAPITVRRWASDRWNRRKKDKAAEGGA